MNLKYLLTACTVVMASLTAGAWGRLGHDAIAYIAERHLTPRAKANIERYLDNHSIVYYASWTDMVRWTPEYRHSSRWHASDVDSLGNYTPSKKRDSVEGVNTTMAYLRNHRNLTDSAVATNIKLIVHLVGDMHCPGHAFYKGYDQKGTKFILDGQPSEVHHFWDQDCLSHHPWHYTEFAHQLDRYSDTERERMASGNPADWVTESGKAITATYDWFENGRIYDRPQTFAFQLEAEKIAHKRIVLAGYRLARLLNEVFNY